MWALVGSPLPLLAGYLLLVNLWAFGLMAFDKGRARRRGARRIRERTLFLSALLGGGLVGIAVGLVMRVGSSTGGTDVVNLVLHKWTHIPVSAAVYLTDIVIMGAQALFSDPEQILYGVVLLVVETIALDRVMLLGQSQIQLFVVSSQYEKLRQKCLTELQAGTTMVYIETGRTRTLQRGVLCVIPPRKLYAAQALIQSVDPHAFLTITQIKEVRGQGFSSERIYVESPEHPIK